MKRYESKYINLYDYDSFMFLEGQTGLPDLVDELYQEITSRSHTVWLLDKLFDDEYKKRVHAIPILNPDVLIFQTTMLNRDGIDDIIYLLETYKWKPKEIWQITPRNIPVADHNVYNIFSFEIIDGKIELTKI